MLTQQQALTSSQRLFFFAGPMAYGLFDFRPPRSC